ncbi:MAG: hypothetical protein P9L98_05290 [Candidatus Kaelpia imicola]|nr:hypothetical protein [Candidatus Kaelpia imicola]
MAVLVRLQSEFGLNRKVLALKLGITKFHLSKILGYKVPVSDEIFNKSTQLYRLNMLIRLQDTLSVDNSVLAEELEVKLSELEKILSAEADIADDMVEKISQLQQKHAQENQREFYYPGYIYARWLLEEAINILGVEEKDFAKSIKTSAESLTRILHAGSPIEISCIKKAQDLLSDEEFTKYKERMEERIAEFISSY